jgi:hypothetical protein
LPGRDFHPLVDRPFAGHTWIRAYAFADHSLRSGCATQAAMEGAPERAIMRRAVDGQLARLLRCSAARGTRPANDETPAIRPKPGIVPGCLMPGYPRMARS